MGPLFAAVLHGCRAGRHQDALREVYVARIHRGSEWYAIKQLGAFGADLSCLTGFFERPWLEPVTAITGRYGRFALNHAGSVLQALARLREAGAPLRAGFEQDNSAEDWTNAAIGAANLSGLLLTLGDTAGALDYARQSVELADRSSDPFQCVGIRAELAGVLLQRGDVSDAEKTFREAERMQEEIERESPILYSLWGFQFCDLLLDLGAYADVAGRATRGLRLAIQHGDLLSMGLDHISLGRAALMRVQEEGGADFGEAESQLHQAVDGLRAAGMQDRLPRGFLARAELYRVTKDFPKARHDLDEAMKIATRSEMKLFEADAHLEYARLHLAMGDKDQGRASLAAGRKLVEDTGYHRRDGAVKKIEEQLG